MKRRQWKADNKAMFVLEGLKGRPVAELRTKHNISQAQYFQWRAQLLGNARRVFEAQMLVQRLTHLQRENAQLDALIHELTVKLKTND